MLNECLNLINTEIKSKVEDKTLTENLKTWRKDRNITKADYKVFVKNILEELLEPLCAKQYINSTVTNIFDDFFSEFSYKDDDIEIIDIIDAIQDIQVFCINETELMGYDNLKCNNEVFKEINSRKQDPKQAIEWVVNGSVGKWKKWQQQPLEALYKANYEGCKL